MADNPQGAHYDDHQDYWSGSPHLKHRELNERLVRLIASEAERAGRRGLPLSILEIGGGGGGVTEQMLARGFEVTSTDMSRVSVESLAERFRHNDSFRGVHDETGTLEVLGAERFAVIVYSSVLHHIPDYIGAIRAAIERHLLPGGALVTLQDPLWYPRQSAFSRRASAGAFLSWRLAQGEIAQGIKTRVRRASQGLSETEESDAVEYHVVRDGVDELAIADALRPSFETVEITEYWSTQGAVQQRAGERLGLTNTFALRASNHKPND